MRVLIYDFFLLPWTMQKALRLLKDVGLVGCFNYWLFPAYLGSMWDFGLLRAAVQVVFHEVQFDRRVDQVADPIDFSCLV